MSLYDYIHLACLALCVFHSIFEFFRVRSLNKKVDHICDTCGSPVVENEEHTCSLTSTQLKALTAFILELKKSSDSKKEN